MKLAHEVMMGDVSHRLSQWMPDLLVSEGPNGSSAGQPVCDQWRSDKEVGIIDLANGRSSSGEDKKNMFYNL